MAGRNNSQREKTKERMRSNILEGKGGERAVSIPGAVRKKKKSILTVAGVIAVLFAVVYIGGKVYDRFRTFSTYQVDWSSEAGHVSAPACLKFADGVLNIGKDGVTLYSERGKNLWSVPYDMKSPVPVTEGNYLLIYDWKGQSMIICDRKGKTGSVSTSYPISKADISAGGVVAAALEDTRSSRITYYRSNGERLEVDIQSPLATSGYPLDIGISPNGQQLAVSYYCIGGGKGFCRVDFYDFEEGKNLEDRIVGSFSYEASDTYIPMLVYNDNANAFAAGDNQLLFYSAADRIDIKQSAVALQGELKKVFYDEKYVGAVLEEDGKLMLRIFDMKGQQQGAVEQESLFEGYCFDGNQVLMYSEGGCRIVTFRGKERFRLDFINGIQALAPAGDQKHYYLITSDMIQRICLI